MKFPNLIFSGLFSCLLIGCSSLLLQTTGTTLKDEGMTPYFKQQYDLITTEYSHISFTLINSGSSKYPGPLVVAPQHLGWRCSIWLDENHPLWGLLFKISKTPQEKEAMVYFTLQHEVAHCLQARLHGRVTNRTFSPDNYVSVIRLPANQSWASISSEKEPKKPKISPVEFAAQQVAQTQPESALSALSQELPPLNALFPPPHPTHDLGSGIFNLAPPSARYSEFMADAWAIVRLSQSEDFKEVWPSFSKQFISIRRLDAKIHNNHDGLVKFLAHYESWKNNNLQTQMGFFEFSIFFTHYLANPTPTAFSSNFNTLPAFPPSRP